MSNQEQLLSPTLETPQCPEHGVDMSLRTVRGGRRRGEKFWGCPNYSSDDCRLTVPFGDPETAIQTEENAKQNDEIPELSLEIEDYEDPGSCPKCGSVLRLKPTRRGTVFWSCPEYPKCRGAKDAVRLGEAPENEGKQSPSRVNWLDGLLDRPGWVCRYTNVGGTVRSSKNAQRISTNLAQVFVAQTHTGLVSDPEVVDVCSVLSKIIQRGKCPPIHPDAETELLDLVGWSELTTPSSLENDLRWEFSSDPVKTQSVDLRILESESFEIDSNIVFDSEDERLFLTRWLASIEDGRYLRWSIPQVQFSAITPDSPPEIAAQRVDFIVAPPGIQPLAIEIDGSQHKDSKEHDAERDQLLDRVGIKVVRVDVSEIRSGDGPGLSQIEEHLAEMHSEELESAAAELVITSAQIHRLFLALVDGLRSGILSGDLWSLEINDPTGNVSSLIGPYLRLVESISSLWGTTVSPSRVFVGDGDKWLVMDRESQYQASNWNGKSPETDLTISLEFSKSAIEPLPEIKSDNPPHTIIRSAFLPAVVGDDLFEGTVRRYADTSDDRSLKDALTEILRAVFAKDGFREGQLEAIEQLVSGGDCTVLLPTGGGKSLIYQLSGLCLPGRTLVVDPLIALMEDQVRGLAENGIDRVVSISAYETSQGNAENVLQQVRTGDALFIFIAPERLQKRDFRSSVRSLAQSAVVNLAVIDEAHCVSEWGHQFRLAYLTLGETIRTVCRDSAGQAPPIAALTGTASRAVLRDVLSQLGIPADSERSIIRPSSFDRKELEMNAVYTSPDEAEATLIGQLRSLPGRYGVPSSEFFRPRGQRTSSGIIFCPHASWDRGVWNVSQLVRAVTGTQPAIYAGGMPRDLPTSFANRGWEVVKRENASRFVNNEVSTIVTTNAFGMGIDIPNIRYVIHYGMPGSIEAFYQEVGRAGRDRDKAITVLVLDELDDQRNQKLLGDPLEDTRRSHDGISRRDSDDISRQLYFLLNTFKGVDLELQEIANIVKEINSLGTLGSASTVELRYGADENQNTQRERAIYRLMMMGIVADYTKESSFVVTLADTDSTGVLSKIALFVDRNFPGRQESLPDPSSNITDMILASAKSLIEMIYDSLVASRISSLNEMYLAARAATTAPDVLRQRVLEYLTQGDVSPVFETLMDQDKFSYDAWFTVLERYSEEDAGELRGTAARLLAASPDHPGLLLARGYAELVHPLGELDTMATNIRASAQFALDRYGSTVEEIEKAFELLLEKSGRSSDTTLAVNMALAKEFDSGREIRVKLSQESLERPDAELGLMVIAFNNLLQSSAELLTDRKQG
jgi:ATP-dependent DNA helicase RecQ